MLNILLLLLVFTVVLPIIFLVVQLLSANLGKVSACKVENVDLSNTVVVIPAHNEEAVIEATLHSLVPQLPDSGQVVLVADNCLDNTSEKARQFGVHVIERNNLHDRGKGFALEAAVQYLKERQLPPDFVVIVDADCQVKPGSLDRLVYQCELTGRPIQALDLMRSREPGNTKQKVAELAWTVKNHVRPLGLLTLGLPCQLMGTGMTFPFQLLKQLDLGSSHIAEDMKLGVDCALAGHPPLFCPEALVESYFPEKDSSLLDQRQRWEHGHLNVIFSECFDLLKAALRDRNKDLLLMSIDLLIPPLAFLVLISVVVLLTVTSIVFILEKGILALVILLVALTFLSISMLLSWHRFARDIISGWELIWIPVYVISKIPLYLNYWIRRQTEWVKTRRD
jgi:cellulose synthase/poly-beta-1,6-N-acetylglucosamine synthase-like glycosyltransferase